MRHSIAVLVSIGVVWSVSTGAASAAPLPGTGSSDFGSSGVDTPIVGEAFLARDLKWTFPAADAPYLAYVRVTPLAGSVVFFGNDCVSDRTGTFGFETRVGADGASRSDGLWMKASQSILDGCAFANSYQEWRVEYETSRGAKSTFFVSYLYRSGNLTVKTSHGTGDVIDITNNGSTIDVRPSR